MAFRYQIKKGAEDRIFANARNLGNGIVESDQPLESTYLELIQDAPANPPMNPPQNVPINQANPPQSAQITNKEGDK